VIPDLPLQDPEAGFEERIRPALEVHGKRGLGIEPIEIAGGHFPMVEDPAALAELLDRVASD
jgi:hypothetical protein